MFLSSICSQLHESDFLTSERSFSSRNGVVQKKKFSLIATRRIIFNLLSLIDVGNFDLSSPD